MCGIAFIINYGDDPYDIDIVRTILDGMEARGTDSSGIYFERPNGKKIQKRLYKAFVPGEKLFDFIHSEAPAPTVQEKEMREKFALDGTEKIVMLHTRKQTTGTWTNNNNNMPIFGDKYILIHNGCVNGQSVPEYKYRGAVDSEEILARAETKTIEEAIEDLSGSMAMALKEIHGDYLYLYRNTNPMDIIWSDKYKVLIGCSSATYVPSLAGGTFVEKLFERTDSVWSLPINTLFKISVKSPDLSVVKEELDSKPWNKK